MELFSLPAVYDTAFQFRNARKAIDFIEECVRTYGGTPVSSVVDIACGTGHYTCEFARRGLNVYGIDISRAMCRYVRQKAETEALTVQVFCCDMVDFSLPRQCELAVCFFDSLTYLPTPQAMISHFRSVARLLLSGSLYILELGVIDSFDNHNVEEVWTENRRDFFVTSAYFREGAILDDRFQEHCTFRAVYQEHCAFFSLKYLKLALTLKTFMRLLDQAGCFTLLALYDDFDASALLDQEEVPWRIIAILQRH
ncbi:methyltransferase type 11 [Candidatus Vecturithrix granuli]|uniref:Methyltransferase type 11 n=1 Tax=Vecturithrix granuli TaxID=1499967 RepID=A0A081BYR8_VECG1|nr:methyltransferase type 11 [Candidatus Vecturithrix granuli]